MFPGIPHRHRFAPLVVCSLFATLGGAGDTRFTYDALGRLVKVVRPDGVQTSYTLDAAGNRVQVVEGLPAPPAPPPPAPPPTPTGVRSNQNSECSFHAQWNSSSGATSYQLRDWSGTFNYPVTSTSTTYSFCTAPGYTGNPPDYRPKWVKACNANGCSAQANFP